MARCFFHGLANYRGKKPPCWVVRFVSCGIGAALHVSSKVCEIFLIILSSLLHAYCHWYSRDDRDFQEKYLRR